jgi:hypothetical protein
MNRLETAQAAYIRAFGLAPPEPWGVNLDRVAEVLENAVAANQAITESFDWWADMPPDAVA